MSFQQLKKDILFQVAEDFAVDLPEGDKDDITKAEIIAALNEDGVTWDMYKKAFPDVMEQDDKPTVDDKPETEVEFTAPKKQVLVKMKRNNGTYVVRGYKFTKEHPYLPMDEEDANYVTENVEGFVITNPREAEEFYS